MKMLTTLAAGAAMAFAAIPFASPAMAQGTEAKFPVPRAGCPKTHFKSRRGSDTIFYCYPKESSNDESSRSSSSSSSGGGGYKDPTFGNLAKADEYDRCPVGYHTSDSARTTCVSYHQDKSPKSRLKKGAACGADEVDEWGLWCTSKTTTLTRAQAEDEAISDVNIIFAPAGRGATQGADYENTPGLVGIFGRKGSGGSASSSGSAGESETAQNNGCANGSATGAAIGGAMAGEGGAVLGSMLGGLGKKKKKKGC